MLHRVRRNSGTLIMDLQELGRLGYRKDIENTYKPLRIYGTSFFSPQSGINGVEWQ